MDIEVLHIDECPGWEPALMRLREALQSRGHDDIIVTEKALRSEPEAGATGFAGSPTIVVDGIDLSPSDGRTASLACRVYRSERGFAPSPTTEQIAEALRARIAG